MRRLPALAAFLCAAAMLVALPLVFRNAFFDINRVKIDWVCGLMPALALFSLVCCLAARQRLPRDAGAWGILLSAALFLLACVLSAARQGFSEAVLRGSQGRGCGLVFLLSCGAAALAIAAGRLRGHALSWLIGLAGGCVALLGVLNALGIDPLHFYAGIAPGQEKLFLSTIGNLDFFGGYVAMLLPMTAVWFVAAKRWAVRCPALLGTIACEAAIAAAGSDSAFAAAQAGFAVLLTLCGDDWRCMGRALLLWALSFAALLIMQPLLLFSVRRRAYTGLFLALCQRGVAAGACALLVLAAVLCLWLGRRGVRAPGRNRLMVCFFVVGAAMLLAALAAIYRFTVLEPERELGALGDLLRFDDSWGTRRGFVYRRAVRALADYSTADWLLGRGVDCTRAILSPYFDNPDMLRYGVFNDAHCQVLQYLLTIGLPGTLSLIACHVLALHACWRRAAQDPLLTGVCASLGAYTVVALVSVAQPILMATYLSVVAVAVSRMLHLAAQEESYEP
ncbi:MAG: O-antigen ligase family protein [Candidatus Ventricola sp.]